MDGESKTMRTSNRQIPGKTLVGTWPNHAMLLEELVEQHRVHCVVANGVRFSFFVGQHQRWVHLCDFFSDQTKLWCISGVGPVMERDRSQCQDCFTGFLHGGDVLLEPLRRDHRAQLASVGHNYWRRSAALRSHAKDIADPSGVAHICTRMTNSDNLRGRDNL